MRSEPVPARRDLLEVLGRALETRIARFCLIVLIIVSVLPYEAIETALRSVFLVVFGLEFGVRILLARRKKKARRVDWFFLVVDIVALLSFLPWADWLREEPLALSEGQLTLIRLARLARLLVLLRYSQQLARDVYAVMTRREQLHHFAFVTMAVGFLAFLAAVVLSHLDIEHSYSGPPGTEPDGFFDRLWWAFRQIESPDNLVPNLRSPWLLTAVSLGLTITGIFVVSYLIGLGTNVVDQVVLSERRRRIGYVDHSLVIGPVHHTEQLIREFVDLYEKNRSLRRIRPAEFWKWLLGRGPLPRRHALPRMALLGSEDAAPPYLHDRGMQWVVYRHGDPTDVEALERSSADRAKRAILLARGIGDLDADAITIASLAAFRSVNADAHVFVEVVDGDNKSIVQQVGGAGTFPLDVHSFIGLFICHHLLVPRIDALFRELLAAAGSEIYTHVFVEEYEHRAIANLPSEQLSFAALSALAHRHQVVLIGALLSERPVHRTERGLIPIDELDVWINPEVVPDDGVLSTFGVQPGFIPRDHLRGFVAISESYEPLRDFARACIQAPVTVAKLDPAISLHGSLKGHVCAIRRLLVVGYSPAIGPLLQALAQFVPDLEITLAISARPDAQLSLGERLRALRLGIEDTAPPGESGKVVHLPRGGRVTIFTHESSNLAGFLRTVVDRPIDTAVFLSDPDSIDRDARTAMRVLRFARMIAEGELQRSQRLQLLVEMESQAHGQQLREQVLRTCAECFEEGLEFDLVSTAQIKNYFMLHSAFVPGVTNIYHRLLAPGGTEFVRLESSSSDETELSLDDIRDVLSSRGVLPISIELISGEVLTNPPPSRKFRPVDIRAIFGLATCGSASSLFPPGDSPSSSAHRHSVC